MKWVKKKKKKNVYVFEIVNHLGNNVPIAAGGAQSRDVRSPSNPARTCATGDLGPRLQYLYSCHGCGKCLQKKLKTLISHVVVGTARFFYIFFWVGRGPCYGVVFDQAFVP